MWLGEDSAGHLSRLSHGPKHRGRSALNVFPILKNPLCPMRLHSTATGWGAGLHLKENLPLPA